MNSYFFILADQGNLKAYRAEKAPGERPPRMVLVQALSLAEAHLSPAERFTDDFGAFPIQTGAGPRQTVQGNSAGEKHYDIEDTRRLVKQLGGHISEILRREKPEWWSFAAPAEIQEAVLAELEPDFREHLAERLPRDLVNTPPQGLLEHFSAVRTAPE